MSNDLFGVAIHPSSPHKYTLFLTYVKLLHPPNCTINASKAAAQHARNVETSFNQRLFSIMVLDQRDPMLFRRFVPIGSVHNDQTAAKV